MTSNARRAGRALALLLLAGGGVLAGDGLWLHAKAGLAQVLLERAWDRKAAGAATPRPWPWADTSPVARLRVPRLAVDQVVLADASGRTLAFGPGHLPRSAPPGGPGHAVVGGHRDTHFSFLAALTPDEVIEIERPDGGVVRYRYEASEVVDSRVRGIVLADEDLLTLVTCYPFDAIRADSPLRFVAHARRLDGDDS
ncbi:MAG: class GN sortase [Pseudomonadota bacterium]